MSIDLVLDEEPRASVMIVCRTGYEKLRACLAALARHLSADLRYEVIVLLNGAEPSVARALREEVSGIHVLVSEVNLGFAGGNNRAARHARGEYLVLLNDDTEVEAEWLESLVEAADGHPGAGAVGSRLLFPDGSLQEAGSVIWSDGTTAPRGRGLPAGSRAFSALRPVDYCSASALLVRRSTWEAVGGFDEEYSPAYYEDTDLCLAVADRGERVVYQPRARVLHQERSSSDEDFRRFLFRRNVERLRAKWATRLAELEPPPRLASPGSAERAVHRAQGCPPRLLAVDSRIPAEGLGAGYPRMLDMLRGVAGRFSVAFHATERSDGDFAALGRRGIELVEGDLVDHLSEPGVVYEAVVLSRPNEAARIVEAVRRHQPTAALIYDVEALYHRRAERKAALVRDAEERRRLLRRARQIRAIEEAIAREVDQLVCLSPDEGEHLRGLPGHAPLELIEQYRPAVRRTDRGYDERRDALFAAGWAAGADSPNGDGLEWLVSRVMPAVFERLPWVRLLVTGDPPELLRHLAGPNVTFLGYVEDLRAVYDRVRVVVVPLRYGAGVKMKTTEAIQFGVPTVATTVGAEGVGPEYAAALEIADEPGDFAARLVRLLADRTTWDAHRSRLGAVPIPRGSTRRWREVIEAAMLRRPA